MIVCDVDNKKICGVCSGLAKAIGRDPLIVRILFVIGLFVSFGTFVFVYLLLWLLMRRGRGIDGKTKT